MPKFGVTCFLNVSGGFFKGFIGVFGLGKILKSLPSPSGKIPADTQGYFCMSIVSSIFHTVVIVSIGLKNVPRVRAIVKWNTKLFRENTCRMELCLYYCNMLRTIELTLITFIKSVKYLN